MPRAHPFCFLTIYRGFQKDTRTKKIYLDFLFSCFCNLLSLLLKENTDCTPGFMVNRVLEEKTDQNMVPQLERDEDIGKKRQLSCLYSSRFLTVASYSHFATIFGDRVTCTHTPHPHIFFCLVFFSVIIIYIRWNTRKEWALVCVWDEQPYKEVMSRPSGRSPWDLTSEKNINGNPWQDTRYLILNFLVLFDLQRITHLCKFKR